MSDVLQTNIFFFITGLAAIVLTAGIVVALVYLVRVLRDVKHVSEIIRREVDLLEKDITDARSSIREESVRWKQFFRLVTSWMNERPQKRKGGGRKKENRPVINKE